MIPPFKKLNFADQVLQRFQANVAAVLDALGFTRIAQGVDVVYTATSTLPAAADFVLAHNLGRPARILAEVPPYNAFTTPGAGATFVVSNTPNPSPSQSTILFCSNSIRAGAVLTFWCY